MNRSAKDKKHNDEKTSGRVVPAILVAILPLSVPQTGSCGIRPPLSGPGLQPVPTLLFPSQGGAGIYTCSKCSSILGPKPLR